MCDRSKEGPNCMIFTSNLTPDKWRDFFREDDALLCALDRTFDAATVYLMKGESYRGRNLKTYSIEINDSVEQKAVSGISGEEYERFLTIYKRRYSNLQEKSDR